MLGLILTIGGSYAVYRYTYVSTDDNKITSESTSIEFLESNTNVISLENAMPMTETEGKGQTNTFDFVVNTKTSKALDISYSLVLEKIEPTSGYTQLEDKDVNFYLTDYNNNNPLVQNNISKISKDYVIYTKTNSHTNTSKEIKDKYKLRIWLDKGVDISNWNKVTKLEYKFRIDVKTNVGNVDTEETYTVKYNSNTGTGNMPNTTFKQGESKKLSKNTFTKEGYVFAGWSTSNNSKDIVYKDEQEVSNLANVYNGVVNLYAVWVKEGVTYEVRYNANGGTGTMTNSSFTTGIKSKLTKNVFTKTGNIFKGWSTTLNGNVKYNDEEEVIDLTEDNNAIVDLYAVWEKEVVQNGVINGDSTKRVKYNENVMFNVTSTVEGIENGTVKCTNGQTGVYKNNVLTVENISKNTTCTVKIVIETTTLYKDGTLIINEQLKDRTSNIEKHRTVTREYSAMDKSNSYVFSDERKRPWYHQNDLVKNVEIGKKIQPISTENWFLQLENMEKGDFTNLDASKVTNMSLMFFSVGYNATAFNVDLSNWNTSNVTNMYGMFWQSGGSDDTTTWNIGDLSSWDTSKVTNMSDMFRNAGEGATTFNLDLSNWDTSKVTSMTSMFSGAGYNATTWSIGDLSNWNTSSVTRFDGMFKYAAFLATTWTVKIPSKTGSLTNTTSKWYGSSESVYAEPDSGKSFTLS